MAWANITAYGTMSRSESNYKSTFPARIAPFSVPEPLPFSREKQRKARFEREMNSSDLNIPGGSYLDFEPLGVLCLATSARSTPKSIFVERSSVARSVRNRKLIAETVMEF